MASRGHAGGLAAATVAAAAVFDAVGFPLVFIETVGTGQSEVRRPSRTPRSSSVAEMGDGPDPCRPAGVADIVAVNKGDRPGPTLLPATCAMLCVGAQQPCGRRRPRPRRPEVMLSAPTGMGVPARRWTGASSRRRP
jgi:LAO/AO transport system kinase